MLARLLVVVVALASTALAAQEETSRLQLEAPDGWERRADGTLVPPGGNAAVVFLPSTLFSGTAEEWLAESWNSVRRELQLTAAAEPAAHGRFLRRMGHFQQADGTNVWLLLNTLVADGRGEGLILLAADQENFHAQLAALNAMLQETPAPVAPGRSAPPTAAAPAPAPTESTPSTPAAHRGPPIPEAAEVAGFYRLTKRVFEAAPFGSPGSGQLNFRKLYYLLSSDGRVFRGVNSPDLPGGAIESFDFDAAARRAPKDAGTYRVKGDEVILTLGGAPHQVVVATRSRDRLKLNDPAFTYGEFSFFRSIRGLPAPARGPAKPPEVVRVPAASVPVAIDALPTLVYVAPAGFHNPTGTGRHESIATGQARVEVYDFRRFDGKDFEQEFRATRFRDWLAEASREDGDKIVGEVVVERQSSEDFGAEQVFSATFQDASANLQEIVDSGAPRIRSRFAILKSGAVALVDLMIRDGEALQNQQAGLNAFSESLKILPAPPPMQREDILAIAGVWEWDGWSGYGKEALPHEEQAQIESYVFSTDGKVATDHGTPDFRTFDFAKAATAENTVGTYFKRGDQIVMRFGASPFYVYSATIKGRDTLEILGYTYHRRQRVEAR